MDRWLELPARSAQPQACALGNFDGVHLGHQAVIAEMIAAGPGLTAGALVLDPHPRQVLHPDQPPSLLTTMPERAGLLTGCGIERCYRLPFTDQVRTMSAEAFVVEILKDRLDARMVAVGRNYRFGYRAQGDVSLLRRLGRLRGIEVVVAKQLRLGGHPISASMIRRQLAAGQLAMASRRLGRYYQSGGTVVPGDRRGTTIGFPTANLRIPDFKLQPQDGIYAAWAKAEGGDWQPAAVHLGPRPMFGPTPVLEVHLIDGAGELYGQHMEVAWVRRLRAAASFADVSALIREIGKDVRLAREVLGRLSPPPSGQVEGQPPL
ncbi:MAG: riboflavin biosynthesis protein RibF [Sulfobacillus sp.]